jgi:hypothetical protein
VFAFKGLVYADAETRAVKRIEMQRVCIPAKSDYEALAPKLSYKLTEVAGQEFVLPSDFELSAPRKAGKNRLMDNTGIVAASARTA